MGQEVWTIAHGAVLDSSATYAFRGRGNPHANQVKAYSSTCYSAATHAYFHFTTAGRGTWDVYINQQNFTDQWDYQSRR